MTIHHHRLFVPLLPAPSILRLADALAALPEPMREVVVLKHLRGCTLAQIGEQISRSVPAVASLLRRGLEELRHRLAPEK
jgi:RNA polymerase sigma-70 factor, ECF subfamily